MLKKFYWVKLKNGLKIYMTLEIYTNLVFQVNPYCGTNFQSNVYSDLLLILRYCHAKLWTLSTLCRVFQYGKLKDVKFFFSYFDNYFLVENFQRKSFVKQLSWPRKIEVVNKVKTMVIKFFRIWEVNFNIFCQYGFLNVAEKSL